MDSDTLIILLIIAVFAVYMGVFNKTQEAFEQQQKGIETSSGDFSPVEQDDIPPCYIVKSVYDKDDASNIKASNYDVYEKESKFDTEYTNLSDYFGTNAKKIEQKKYYDTITAANISNYQFEQNLDMSSLWNEDKSLKHEAVEILLNSIMANNPKMVVTHINKQTNELNMLPYFIDTSSVEYFRVIDTVRSKIIFFFVTPKGTGVY